MLRGSLPGSQRCRVHFQRNALAHAEKSGRRVVSAFVATAFAQDTAGADFAESFSTNCPEVVDRAKPDDFTVFAISIPPNH
jgi:putative transposase